jgi:hypothetical protein
VFANVAIGVLLANVAIVAELALVANAAELAVVAITAELACPYSVAVIILAEKLDWVFLLTIAFAVDDAVAASNKLV